MRTAEINKWIEEGGDLPQDLTSKEKEYLEELGWKTSENWFENGQRSYVENYLNGQKHGKQEGCFANGQRFYVENYLNGQWHGKREVWFENGQRSYVRNFLNGQEHGKQESWYENGQKHYEKSFIYGMKHDTVKNGIATENFYSTKNTTTETKLSNHSNNLENSS